MKNKLRYKSIYRNIINNLIQISWKEIDVMCASLRIYKDYVKQVKIKKDTENMLKKIENIKMC